MHQFNNAGPTVSTRHYALDPLKRINLGEILGHRQEQRYFVLHAPRQTGKTTCLLALMCYLNAEGNYRAVYANVEGAQTARNNVEIGMRAITGEVAEAIRRHTGDAFPGFRFTGSTLTCSFESCPPLCFRWR